MLLQIVLMMMAGFDPTVLTAHAAPVELNSTTTIAAYVREVQHKYGLGDDFYETLEYESAGWQNIQSRVVKNGVREESYGIAQINLPAHPTISKAQALDVRWAVNWAAQEFQAKRQWQWTAWNVFHKDAVLRASGL